MNPRITYLAAVFMLLLSTQVFAQDLPFHIGSAYVAPEAEYFQGRVFVTWPVKSFYDISTPPPR